MNGPLKWHGGKHYLAARIVALMPPHVHYVEPYAGGLSVMLAKNPEGVSEVANDLHGDLSQFWCILADADVFPEFLRLCQATPFSEYTWRNAVDVLAAYSSSLPRTWAFFVSCRQSLAGRGDSFAPLSRTRTRRGMNEQASAWLSAVEGLPAVHERLKRVAILNQPAMDVIRQQDGPETCFYLDPPYLHETRATTGEYKYEMTRDDHLDLLAALGGVSGKFLLSGYRSDIYDAVALANGWNRHDFELPNNSAGGKSKRRMTECLWTNF